MHQLALGAGTGTGSCRAFPYRAAQVPFCLTCSCRSLFTINEAQWRAWLYSFTIFSQVDWDVCPSDLPCCNEYGYCRSRVCCCLLALIEDLSQTWQVVDHLELESTQPLHAARSTIHTIHYLEAWCCSRRSTHSSLSTPSPNFFGSEDHTAI